MSDFLTKFKVNELLVHENKYWTWSLRPEQVTLGSSVLYLKTKKTNFSDLSANEMLDLKEMIGILESTLSRALSYDRINYLMLMMVDKCVHLHVIPRYKEERMYLDKPFRDIDYPKPPSLVDHNVLNMDSLKSLANYLTSEKDIRSNNEV